MADHGSQRDTPIYELGDQDYGSMAGYDPWKEKHDKLMAEALKKRDPRYHSPKPDMFQVYRAGELMQSEVGRPAGGQLFGPFWLEHEMAILFAQTGIGKSLLATQIAESLARGRPIPPFDKFDGPKLEPQRVLYLDFELSKEQFTARYSVPDPKDGSVTIPYPFSPDFLRAEHFWDGRVQDGYRDLTDMLFTDIEDRIQAHETQVLIVDNISFLTRSSTSYASVAFRLMNLLQDLKRFQWISILVLAHTPKRRPDLPLRPPGLGRPRKGRGLRICHGPEPPVARSSISQTRKIANRAHRARRRQRPDIQARKI